MFSRLRGEFSFVHGNVLILMISWFLTDFAGAIPNTYYSLYVLELGGTPFVVGLIGSASSIVLALVQFLGGYLADKRGRKQVILIMSFGVATSYILFASALNWYFILVGAVFRSFCLMFLPAMNAMTADSIPPEKRGLGYSITILVGAVSIISPLVAGFLYITQGLVLGIRIAYWIATVAFFAAATMRFRLKETLKTDKSGAILKNAFKTYKKAVTESFRVWKLIPKSALALLLVYSIPSFFIGMCLPYYVIYATNILHVDKLQYAMMLTLQSITFYGSVLPIGKLVDKAGRKNPLIAASILLAVGIWLFMYGDVAKLYFAFFLFALENSLVYTAYPSLQADIVPREHRGKVWGFLNFVDSLLASISLIVGGFLYENISSQLPFFLLLASVVPTLILTLLIIHEPKKREK